MPFTKLCPQCSASVNVKKAECVCGHTFCKRRSIATKGSKMAKKRALEPESEALLRKEHDRASKAKKRALESELKPY